MFRNFVRDQRGNFMMIGAFAMVPIMGALALGVDYTEITRQRQATMNALDAAGIATARRVLEGATDQQAIAYAEDFFEANLGPVDPKNAKLTVVLPKNNAGGGTLKVSADLTYKPYFLPAFTRLLSGGANKIENVDFNARSEIRLKNTLEVALVLDNSGSMDYLGSGSGKKRMVLLKDAAKQLVDTLSAQAAQMKQVSKPVQFSLVPFAASVNVGPDFKTAAWMDTTGISPMHYENFKWSTAVASNQGFKTVNGVVYKDGTAWGAANNTRVTRFTLFDELKRQVCTGSGSRRVCTPTAFVSWKGCVESRPNPYNVNDTAASTTTPATLFVPMFAPDEPGNKWTTQSNGSVKTYSAANSWWDDLTTSTSTSTTDQQDRQGQIFKYFTPATSGFSVASDGGPNDSCTTNPITPLTDVSTSAGVTAIKAAIDAMESNGATNVPEGMAWGWRTLSSTAPFTEGRPETEKGNDKVVIVLTDGANTYYTPSSLGYSDPAGNKSIYSSFGYTGKTAPNATTTRLYLNTSTSVSKTTYSNDNYTAAMNEHFTQLCNNAKAGNLIVMTVSLDLSSTDTEEKAQIAALKACSSDSRFRKDSSDVTKPAKLYWNATGSSLSETFKQIGDELSNLRIVS